MSALLRDLLAFGVAHPHLVGAVAFLAAFVESLALVGTLIPGGIILVATGALVPAGVPALPLAAWAVAGAVAGDGLSFWIGRRYRAELRAWPPFARRPGLIAGGEAYFRAHGGKSVILARFVGFLRAIIPLVAGMAGMSPPRFLLYNVASALLWVPAMLLPGILFGAALTLAATVSARLLLLAVTLLVGAGLAVWCLRLVARRAVPRLARGLDALADWAEAGGTAPRRLLRLAIGPNRSEVRLIAGLGVLSLLGLWGFLGILEDVLTGDPLVRAGEAVHNLLHDLRTPWSDRVMVVATALGDGVVAAGVAGAAVAWLAWRRAWRAAAFLLGAVGLTAAFVHLVKGLLRIPRPVDGLYAGWDAFSFPSGHASTNAALYGFLALLALRELPPRASVPLLGVTAGFVALIGFSRLYLGAHWLPDVLAGIGFAVAWAALLAAAYFRLPPERLGAPGLLAVALAALVAFGGWHVSRHYDQLVARYAPRAEALTVAAGDWWAGDWTGLPARRVDLAGEWEEPFALQWAGEPAAIEAALRGAGWSAPTDWTITTTLAWLAPGPDPAAMPVLPKLNDGRRPLLTLLRAEDGRPSGRLVLRLWRSGVLLRDAAGREHPLLVGSLVRETFVPELRLVTLARAAAPPPGAEAGLEAALRDAGLPVTRRPRPDGADTLLLARDSTVAF